MSESKDKTLKARLPRGLADRSAADIRATERMLATIKTVYERYGFEPVETPLIEYTDALGKFLPDQDRPNEGVFSFQDDDEQWLSLRYDLTAPLARYVAENFDKLPKPYRSYRAGWVFRNEKPGPGRFRQFMQFDADTVGASSPAADAEICMMAADTLEALGIPRGQYVIKVNSRKVLDGVMEAIGVSDEKQKLTVLRAIDKLDRLGDSGVADLLGQGRKDESGDFTKGAGLGPEAVNRVLNFTGWRERGSSSIGGSNTVTLANFAEAVVGSELGSAGVADLNSLGGLIDATGYSDRVRIDPSVVRGLEYYTGAVFEAELTFEVTDDEGRPVRFGSVGRGGRYDGLIGRFRGEDTPATGFSIGVSRLRAALAALKQGKASEDVGPVVVTVMEKNRIGDYQRMVSRLREAGIAAELYLGDAGFRAQMKYADRRNAPVAVIQGGDEKAKGVVQIKDLAAGKAASQAISDNTAWREERPGQFEVSEDDLVAAIRKIVEARR
jgi:histidyl-tRNA synthetase